MYDGISRSDPGIDTPGLQRARGRARLTAAVAGGRTRLHALYQDGCAKIRLPKVHGSTALEAVLLNTAGGLTGGDRVETEIVAGPEARVTVTSQACERVYRSPGGEAGVATRLALAADASVDWLPQETILFDGGRIARTLDIDMAVGARLLAVEPVLFGRVASGEVLGHGLFRDSWRVRRGGRLAFADETRVDGPMDEIIAGPGVLGGCRAAATVLLVAADAEALLEPVRALLAETSIAAGASTLDGLLLCRLAAPDAMALRGALIPLLTLLRGGEDLPKAWHT